MKPEDTKQIKNFIYNLNDQIGKGFSSIVYKGTNLNNKSLVAIKVIDLKTIKTDVEKKLLGNEMKALKMLNHQNIIQSYDIYQTANNAYIVSEYCAAGDLAAYYSKSSSLSENEIIKLFTGIVAGVQHLASKGIIHRDLKPANILISNGIPKIIDFGFCDLKTEKQEPKMKYNVGSPLYMSPEAYRNTNYSDKSDVWAVGIILYEMIIAKTPFKGMDYDTMVKGVASGEIYKTIDNGFFKMLLSRMLSIDVQRRADINEVASMLSQQSPIVTTTVNKKTSGINNFSKNNQTQIKKQKHVSLNKTPLYSEQASPRKAKPVLFPDNPTLKRQVSCVQSVNADIMPKRGQSSSNLTTYLIFLYRVCKITRNQSSKSTFIERIHHLSLAQLKSLLDFFQGCNIPSSPDSVKICNFTKESLDQFNITTYSNDLYFINICTRTSNWLGQTATDYIIFWIKLILSQLYQQFSRVDTVDLSETQKFQVYLYCSEYYKLLKSTRGKRMTDIEGLIELANLSKLLNEKKVVSKESIKEINRHIKTVIDNV